MKLSSGCSRLEAITAIYRTLVLRLERYLSLLAALSADYIEHLALLVSAFTAATAFVAAIAAAYRLVFKALFRVKFLFSGAEGKVLTTVLAS